MLSQIYAVYYPLGLLCPITIKYKLLLQRMVVEKKGWDEPLEGDLLEDSRDVLIEMIIAGEIKFYRAAIPEGSNGVGLVGFNEGEALPQFAVFM